MSQDPKRKLTPEEVLDAIEDADAADEAERILALSDEELDRELKEGGFDPEEVRAEGRAIAERARMAADLGVAEASTRGSARDKGEAAEGWVSAPPPTAPRGSTRARWPVLLAATMAAAVAVGALYALGRREKPEDPPTENLADAGPPAVPAPDPSSRLWPPPALQDGGARTPDNKPRRR